MVFLKPQELRQMIVGIMQAKHILETDIKREHPDEARKIREAEDLMGPEGSVATIFQLESDRLIQTLYELDKLVGIERTGSLLQ